jgi:hypothetical protein
MIYESTITYKGIDNKGVEKLFKESYVISNAELFAEVENKMQEEFTAYQELDVVDIKRSKIKEIANGRTSDDENLWMSELLSVFIEDDGTEKEIKNKVLFFATTYDKANAFITQYVKQGYNMEIISTKKTHFLDVLD